MSDHFDNKLKRKLASDTGDTGHGVSNVRRIELITGTGRRRRWSRDDKARIVEESLKPGATVSEVARRNGLSPQQLFAWRRAAHALFNAGADATRADRAEHFSAPRQRRTGRQARLSGSGDETPAFAPVVIAAHQGLPRSASKAPAPSSPPPSQPPLAGSGTVEIEVGDAVVRIVGQVETSVLVAVLRAVRRAS
jgi:transposase